MKEEIKELTETLKSQFQLISNLSDEDHVFNTCEAGIGLVQQLEGLLRVGVPESDTPTIVNGDYDAASGGWRKCVPLDEYRKLESELIELRKDKARLDCLFENIADLHFVDHEGAEWSLGCRDSIDHYLEETGGSAL